MSKRSKLSEKPARMPEVRQPKWDRVVSEYIQSVRELGSESAKSHRFSMLLQELFGIQPRFIEEYVEGIEKYVRIKEKDRILRGKVDNLFGNLVIEFERDLSKTRAEAEDQVKKYVAVLWSQERPGRRWPYVGIATDGVAFAVYSPSIDDEDKKEIQPEDVWLQPTDEVDLSRMEATDVYFWLDRYFLRKELLPPTTDNIVNDFGVQSHAFGVAGRGLLWLWQELKGRPEFAVVYESWEKYLLIVYGSSVADEELFSRHTYLATLAKLMAWCRLTEATTADGDEIVSVLEGDFFKRQGIENFLEEDFFSWVTREEARDGGVEMASRLFSLLQKYNLRELSEDVLKSLYQELVDPETRHDLGEYYTPDWLAHRMVRKLLDEKPDGSLLDPACGSGTFLYLAIREKRERLGDSLGTLRHIQDSVVGIDIHPLAVIVAKTNYVLGLGDLLRKRRASAGKVTIPVYLADSIRLPEWREKPTLWMQLPSYKVTLDDTDIYLPEKLISDPGVYDEAIEAAREFGAESAGRSPSAEHFANYVGAQGLPIATDEALVEALFHLSEALRGFIESDRDTIWAFVLKNIYKPLFLKGEFDFVAGNPPWLAYRYAHPDYQEILKDQITTIYRLVGPARRNMANLELGTLFLLRSADLYLKAGGGIAFVLPRSVFSADQHDQFRRAEFRRVTLRLTEIWDLEKASPLFKVPSCVVFAAKLDDPQTMYPVAGQELEVSLAQRNAGLSDVEASLLVTELQYSLNEVCTRSFWGTGEPIQSEEPSAYMDGFRRGADLYPRALWFVAVKPSPVGFDPSVPPLKSAHWTGEYAKRPWKNLVLTGRVESRFLYATLHSMDLLPFGQLRYRLVVVPVEPADHSYRLLSAEGARERGFLGLAQWLERAGTEWRSRRGEKAERMSLYQRLDYQKDLTSQNPHAKHRVLYPSSATYLCACIVEDSRLAFHVAGQEVLARGFLADVNAYVFETSVRGEAFYLAAILNAPLIDRVLKPMQSRGLFGPRHIHKKVLELPIAQFDTSCREHLQLAEIGDACTQKVTQWLEAGGRGEVQPIGRLRTMVREMLADELREIDRLVEPMLRGGAR